MPEWKTMLDSIAWWHVALGLVGVWLAINFKTSRPDGTLLRVHPYRRLLGIIMPSRNEAVVYFDDFIRADKLLAYVEVMKQRFPVDITHCLVGASARAFAENDPTNRFMVGGRLYQRRSTWLTFSMKRKQMDKQAKLSAVKLAIQTGETFAQLCGRINTQIEIERSGKKTYSDKELGLFDLFPRVVLTCAYRLLRWLDYHNLLPLSFIQNDGMFTSMFIANLGSLKMGAGYHHLFEWGTCPLFLMVGQIQERPWVEDGKVVAAKILHVRWSYDERIDDGLNARFGIDAVRRTLEHPFEELGCTKADGSDTHPLDSNREQVKATASAA